VNSIVISNITALNTTPAIEQHLLGLKQGLEQGLAHIHSLLLVTLVANLLEMILLSVPDKYIKGNESIFQTIKISLRLIQVFLLAFLIGLNYVDLKVAIGQ